MGKDGKWAIAHLPICRLPAIFGEGQVGSLGDIAT